MKLEIDYTPPDSNINHNFTYGSGLEEMLNAGIDQAKNGNRAEARNLLLRVTEADADNENAWLWLASISEYPEELLVFLQNVLKINPENERALEWMKATKSMLADTFVKRGIDAMQESRKEYAAQCFMQALLHDSRNESAWLWLASSSDSPEEKKAHLQKVLELNPENETALAAFQSLRYELTQSLLKKANFAAISGEREEARKHLEEAMRDAPESEEAWILKAYLADDSQEKIACYEKVLELNPENETAQAGLASLNALIQKNSEQKSNAEMLREVLESSGAEVLSPDSLPDFSQPDSFEAPEQSAENFEAATGRSVEINESLEESVAETYSFGDPVEESSENPTEDLNANFIEEVKSRSGFAQESFGDVFASENPVHQDRGAENENQLFAAAESGAVQPIDESDDVLQFVKAAEARVFQSEETEGVSFENIEQPEEVPQEDDSLSYQFPDISENTNFEIASEMQPGNEFASAGELPHIDHHSFSNDAAYSEQNVPSETIPETADSHYTENAQSAAETQAEPFEKDEDGIPAQVELEDTSGNFVHKHLPQGEPFSCAFCYAMNEPHTVVCSSCRTMLSLSDLETLLAYTEADSGVLEMAIEDLENEKSARNLDADELTNLGIAYLNVRNLRKALNCLQDASQLSPNDVVLASKVNFLAIRLSEIEAHESKMEGASVKNLTVMVIDDSPTVRKLISGKLEKCGHMVVTAGDGAEALEKIKEVVPDLILLDIMMPKMDGYQVCKLIRSSELTKDVPVVMISGKDGFFDKVRGRMAGTTGFITKPFGPETLMRTIETYVP